MIKSKTLPLLIIWYILAFFICDNALAQPFREKAKRAFAVHADKKALEVDVESALNSMFHDGRKRTFYVYEPSFWDKKSEIPLVFLFHGGGGGARGSLYYYELEKKAEEAGFLLVAPNGTGETEHILLTWNVKFGFGYAQKNNVDDVGFVNALIDHLQQRYPIDAKRIFATGLSNGAILCHFLGAHLSHRIAAIAPVVGTLGGKEPGEKDWLMPPSPKGPVSVCILQGLIDKSVPINGQLQQRSIAAPKIMMSASDTIDFWVQANGCNSEGETWYDKKMLTTVHKHTDGKNNSEVIAYVIHNMGHAWPGSTRVPRLGSDKPSTLFPGNDIIWEFFKNHPKP